MKLTLDNPTACRVMNDIGDTFDVTVSVRGDIMSVSGEPNLVDKVHLFMQRYIPTLCKARSFYKQAEVNSATNTYRFF